MKRSLLTPRHRIQHASVVDRVITRQRLLRILFLLVVLYIFLPQIPRFQNSFAVFREGQPVWLAGAIACTIGSYFAAALVYKRLSLVRVTYGNLLLVQAATGFANRLLPAGVGGMGLYARFFTKLGNSFPAASAIVITNNVLGFVGSLVIVVCALLVSTPRIIVSAQQYTNGGLMAVAAFAVAVGLFVVLRSVLKRHARKFMGLFMRSARRYGKHNAVLLSALALSTMVTVCYAAALYATAEAFSIHLAVVDVVLLLFVGVAVGSVTPLPGGLVGAEAGMLATLISTGVDESSALAVVLTYRFITFWLPIAPGVIAFNLARNKHLL